MSRLAKKYINANYHHVMVQGINKEKIFYLSEEKERYRELLKRNKKDFNIKVIAYCFMDNHMHLVLYSKTIEEISKYMHHINMDFAISYNRKNSRVGYVFRNRFKSEPIYDKIYLKNCISYVHNNPVKAGICVNAGDYNFSSYKEIVSNKSRLVSTNMVNKIFENSEDFNRFHGKIKFDNYLDTLDEKQQFIKSEIDIFMKENSINKSNIRFNDEIINPFIKEILDRKIISKTNLAKLLNVSLYKINNLNNEL